MVMADQKKDAGQLVYLTTMISLASAAFGVIAALAWNSAITELFKTYFPAGIGIVSLFVYAIVVTIIAVIVMVNLGNAVKRVEERSGGTSKPTSL
jgi:hypothetical protein